MSMDWCNQNSFYVVMSVSIMLWKVSSEFNAPQWFMSYRILTLIDNRRMNFSRTTKRNAQHFSELQIEFISLYLISILFGQIPKNTWPHKYASFNRKHFGFNGITKVCANFACNGFVWSLQYFDWCRWCSTIFLLYTRSCGDVARNIDLNFLPIATHYHRTTVD